MGSIPPPTCLPSLPSVFSVASAVSGRSGFSLACLWKETSPGLGVFSALCVNTCAQKRRAVLEWFGYTGPVGSHSAGKQDRPRFHTHTHTPHFSLGTHTHMHTTFPVQPVSDLLMASRLFDKGSIWVANVKMNSWIDPRRLVPQLVDAFAIFHPRICWVRLIHWGNRARASNWFPTSVIKSNTIVQDCS